MTGVVRIMRNSGSLTLPVIAFMLLGASDGLACSCAGPADVLQALEQATAVFSGRVVDVIKHKPDRTRPQSWFTGVETVLEVKTVWKRVDKRVVSVFTSDQQSACGYRFRKGRTYLVYAHRNEEGKLVTSICTRTKRLKDAEEDLSKLGPGSVFPETQE
jgi:hypothetical protein